MCALLFIEKIIQPAKKWNGCCNLHVYQKAMNTPQPRRHSWTRRDDHPPTIPRWRPPPHKAQTLWRCEEGGHLWDMWRSVFWDSAAAPVSFLVTLNAIYIYIYHTCVCIIYPMYIYIYNDIHVDTMPWCNLPIFCFQEHPSHGLSHTARITVAPPTTSRAA